MYTLTDLCCLCLVNGNTVRSILLQGNDGIVLKNKLEYVLSEVINFQSEVLQYVCVDCLNALNYVYKFKQECLQNLKSLNIYIEKMKIKQEYNDFDQPGIIQDQVKCANHFIANVTQQNTAEREMKHNHKSESQELKCSMSNAKCIVTSDNNQHLMRENQIPQNNEEIEIVKQELEYINDEIDIKHDPLLFDVDGDSEENTRNNFSNNADYNSTSSEGDGLKDQNVDSKKRYKCDQCHKAFLAPSHLKMHSLIHTGERPYQCTTCQKTFTQLVSLNNHERSHTGEKPYACDICSKSFSILSNLTKHKQIHNNVRPFQCSVCHKTFTLCGNLTKHMLIHTGEKPFKCPVCIYKCASAGDLKTHMRIHTGEKPFTCIHCQRAFSNSSNLKQHMRRQHNKKNNLSTIITQGH